MARYSFDLRYGAVPAELGNAWGVFRETGLDRNVFRAALPLTTANFLHVDAAHIWTSFGRSWNPPSERLNRAPQALAVADAHAC